MTKVTVDELNVERFTDEAPHLEKAISLATRMDEQWLKDLK